MSYTFFKSVSKLHVSAISITYSYTSNIDCHRNKVIVVKVISQWNLVSQLSCLVLWIDQSFLSNWICHAKNRVKFHFLYLPVFATFWSLQLTFNDMWGKNNICCNDMGYYLPMYAKNGSLSAVLNIDLQWPLMTSKVKIT